MHTTTPAQELAPWATGNPSLGKRSLPETIDIAIIGAGPQALTLVTHMLQKKATLRRQIVVLDGAGQWMQQWHHQFAAFEIPHLRSPAVHHPDPDPHALRSFAAGRYSELFPPYDLPGTTLFSDFCQQVIHRWQVDPLVVAAQVQHIEPLPAATPFRASRLRLHLTDGRRLEARRVVLALGGGSSQQPDWVEQIPPGYPRDRLCHSRHIDLRGLRLEGERVLIIGSGLTSAHLAMGAVKRGASVLLMARRRFYEKLFDAEPGWLGPKYLKGFFAEPDWSARWQMIQMARNGGSFTPALMTQLRRCSHQGSVQFYEQCQVQRAQWTGAAWQVTCDRTPEHDCLAHLPIDRIWLATGHHLDVRQWSLLSELQAVDPITYIQGLPILDEHLRWNGRNLFIMGGAAALHLGPVARNLYGAKMASDRIVPALTKATV
ncbi:MAG: FAD/NAD(P)-binding protein [Elainellaceae cyanobacterium]